MANKLGFQIVPKCELISSPKLLLKLMCLVHKGKGNGNAQDLRPTLGEIVDFACELQLNEDTNYIITDSIMKQFHFGCDCHDLGDVTKFEKRVGVVSNRGRKGILNS